jgi:TPR repeat protein
VSSDRFTLLAGIALAACGGRDPAPRSTSQPTRVAAPTTASASAPSEEPARVDFGELCPAWDRSACEELCDKGSALSCARLGRILAVGGADNALLPMPKFEPDPAATRAAWQKACDAKYAPACSELAWFLESGRGGEKQPEKAREINRQLCDSGFGVGCFDLVEESTPPKAALALFEKGCTAGHTGSCLEAGAYYESGTGVAEDMSKAIRFYGRAFFAPVEAKGSLKCAAGTKLFREVNEIELAYVLIELALYCGKPGK